MQRCANARFSRLVLFSLSLGFALLPAASVRAQKAPEGTSALADNIVVNVAAVQEGELVFVQGDVADIARMQDLWLSVLKHGGLPLLRVSDIKTFRRVFDVVPAKYDKNLAAVEEKLVTLPDVVIALDRRDSAALKDVPANRRAAVDEAFSGLTEKALKRGTRQVFLGNGLFPTKEAAKAVGLSEPELKKVFDAGLAADGKVMNASGEVVRTVLQSGNEITVTTKAGTSLRLKLTSKPMNISDGLISPAEAKSGGSSLMTWLPAGEVYGLIAPGSAEGKIVLPGFAVDGGEIVKDVTFTIAGGKVTAVAPAKPSKAFDTWRARYDAAGSGKDIVSILDIGLNPAVKQKGKAILNFVPEGTVTVFVGGDEWAGGANKIAYGNTLFLTDATVKAGDKVVVESGVLKK